MIAPGYTEETVRNGHQYIEFFRQPLHRRVFAETMMEILIRHPWIKIETQSAHPRYGHGFRIVVPYWGVVHIWHHFDDTVRIIQLSYERGIVIPASLDNIQAVMKTVETAYASKELAWVA